MKFWVCWSHCHFNMQRLLLSLWQFSFVNISLRQTEKFLNCLSILLLTYLALEFRRLLTAPVICSQQLSVLYWLNNSLISKIYLPAALFYKNYSFTLQNQYLWRLDGKRLSSSLETLTHPPFQTLPPHPAPLLFPCRVGRMQALITACKTDQTDFPIGCPSYHLT